MDFNPLHPLCIPFPSSSPVLPPVIAQVNSTSITVVWSRTPGKISTTYTLSYTYQGLCAGGGASGTKSIGTATQYTITGLQEFSLYTLTLTASYGVRSSPPTSVMVNTSSAGEVDDLISRRLTLFPSLPQQLPLLPLTTSL